MNIAPLQQTFQRMDWTLTRLAVESGINPNTVGNILAGKSCTVRTVEAVADTLGYKLILVPKNEVEP